MELILFIGIPASGKSAFYKERFFNTHIRVSLDLLNTRSKERKLIDLAYGTQSKLVIDNTNVTADERIAYIEQAKINGYVVTGYYFSSAIRECLSRNRHRTGKDRISDRGLLAKYNALEQPELSEGFDTLYFVKMAGRTFIIEPFLKEVS